MNVEQINKTIEDNREKDESFNSGDISDTYHTFDELYYHRMLLSSVVFNTHSHLTWKSKQHDDGTMFDGMFIVGIETPEGSFTYHYDLEHWDKFNATELEFGRPWDGHTAKDITRLLSLMDSV